MNATDRQAPPFRCRATSLRVSSLFRLAALVLLTTVAPAALPVPTFALVDLNTSSSRVGQTLSPRDYGQWISAYYFGSEA